MREIANFFWHGELTQYEIACYQSAIDNDFDVNVWSFQKLENLPAGAVLKDASEILPEENLHLYKQPHPFDGTDQRNQDYSTIAAFSDVFRIKLLKERGGWWFDSDQFTLKNQQEFKNLRQNKKFCLCFDYINSNYMSIGVIYFDQEVANMCYDRLNKLLIENNNTFNEWAQLGPAMVTNIIENNYKLNEVFPYTTFNPINWKEMNLLLDPEMCSYAIDKCKSSYSISLWNSQLSQKYNLKHTLPNVNSFLYKLLNRNINYANT